MLQGGRSDSLKTRGLLKGPFGHIVERRSVSLQSASKALVTFEGLPSSMMFRADPAGHEACAGEIPGSSMASLTCLGGAPGCLGDVKSSPPGRLLSFSHRGSRGFGPSQARELRATRPLSLNSPNPHDSIASSML